jgi:hypothetical protein
VPVRRSFPARVRTVSREVLSPRSTTGLQPGRRRILGDRRVCSLRPSQCRAATRRPGFTQIRHQRYARPALTDGSQAGCPQAGSAPAQAQRRSGRTGSSRSPRRWRSGRGRVEVPSGSTAKKSQDKGKKDKGQYVKLREEGSDRIFVVLAEFGDNRHPSYCDSTDAAACAFPSDGSPLTYDGPGHNEIPKPNRAVDNTTLWQADYNKAHYQDMYFNRMADYYERQSSGRYTVNGEVTECVKVPFNAARYGRDYCGDIVCNNTWFLLRDALSVWTQNQLAAGMTMPQIQAYLATFDKQDRYDIDLDGNFAEPDGFIDHFQIVHAGGDQAAGDPTYATDAIWSHRWYASITAGGPGASPASTSAPVAPRAARPCPTTRPVSGSATTSSSRRTADSACSRTSSATTSACRTSTTPRATPVARRTPRRSGP